MMLPVVALTLSRFNLTITRNESTRNASNNEMTLIESHHYCNYNCNYNCTVRNYTPCSSNVLYTIVALETPSWYRCKPRSLMHFQLLVLKAKKISPA